MFFQSSAPSAVALALSLCTATLLSAQEPEKKAPASDLDAFMEKVLARREVNRKVLNDYILDETETFEILGPGRTACTAASATSRGTCATACTCAARCGSTA